MIARTVPEVETGFIGIQNYGRDHHHDAARERFDWGLSTPVKENIEEITKFKLQIRPVTMQRILLSEPYCYDEYIVPI
jgi:hypothetical protein